MDGIGSTLSARSRRNGSAGGPERELRWAGHEAVRAGRRAGPQVEAVEIDLNGALAPDLRVALEYWRAKKGQRLAPTRADIDPVDIAALLPRVMLVDVSTDPLEFRYRLAGTGIVRVHGVELTHTRPRDLMPAAYGALVHRHYEEAVTRRAPLVHQFLLERETQRCGYLRIILPLSDDGDCINRLMTVASYDAGTQALCDCFQSARGGEARR